LDALPIPQAVGLRVAIPLGDIVYYGRIYEVNGRHVRVALERRLGNRLSITVNWKIVRIASSQITPDPPKAKPAIDPERIEHLRSLVSASLSAVPVHPDDLIQSLQTCSTLYDNIEQYVQSMNAMRTQLKDLLATYHDARSHALASGASPSDVPPPIEHVQDTEIRTKRRGNLDHRRQLRQLRDSAKDYLSSLINHAGAEGVSSEEIMAVLCPLGIAQHRIMGMLSALSRRKEVVLAPTGRWVGQ
jgi:hypothetical protein